MAKAILINYADTLMQLKGDDLNELLSRCVANSNANDPGKFLEWWSSTTKELEKNSYGEKYIDAEEICKQVLNRATKAWQLNDDLQVLKQLYMSAFMYGPLYTDVKPFMEQVGLPVFIVTNFDEHLIRVNLKRNGIHVNGVICASMVNAYKPYTDVFEKALEVCGFAAEDVIYVGSNEHDIKGAIDAGIPTILLDRTNTIGRRDVSCKIVNRLTGVMKLL